MKTPLWKRAPCQTCRPPYKIKADGHDQPISDNPYYDTLSVALVGHRTLKKIAKKSGKTVAESEIVVSEDGSKMTERQLLFFIAPRPVEMTTHSLRISAGANGSHLMSGTWRLIDGEVSNHAEDTTFKVTGQTLEMSDRMGRSFNAKLDGTEAPYNGSDEFKSVSLKMPDDHTIEESDKKDRKILKISRWAIGPTRKPCTSGSTTHGASYKNRPAIRSTNSTCRRGPTNTSPEHTA